MSGGSPKDTQALAHEEAQDESTETREVYLRDGRRLAISEERGEQLVEIKNEGGLVEVRIRLTEQGPVLQMEAVRMQLKATEAVEIAAPKVSIAGSEQVAVTGTDIAIEAEQKIDIEAKQHDVVVRGQKIWLN